MENYFLTKEEILEFNLINYKFNMANNSLQTNVIESYNFNDEQLMQYLQAAYNTMLEAKFLDLKFTKNLQEKLNLGGLQPIVLDDFSVVTRG